MKDLSHPYFRERMVLTSKHQKLPLIAPIFEEQLQVNMIEIPLDTDLLGTFTGEKERALSQMDTAISKARMGIDATGVPIGIASEGAIGSDSEIPLLNSDLELLVLVDAQRDFVIAEHYRSFDIFASTIKVRSGDDLTGFLLKADFPRHALIAKSSSGNDLFTVKGITNFQDLQKAIEELSIHDSNGLVTVESDLRAHHSPSRQANIKKAAEILAYRVKSQCPNCATPGWGRVSYQRGLFCSDCNLEIPEAIHREILGCVICDYQSPGRVIAQVLDPARCPECNP